MPVTARVEERLAELIDAMAKKEEMDRSTVIRRSLLKATKDWLVEESLAEYGRDKITLWQAASKWNNALVLRPHQGPVKNP
jgi:hypothetical protein